MGIRSLSFDGRTYEIAENLASALSLLNRVQNHRYARITAITDIVLMIDVLSPPEPSIDCRLT